MGDKKSPMIDELKAKVLKEGLENFRSVHHLYTLLHQEYNNPPKGVTLDYWHDKVISALAAQPYLNLPKCSKILYSGKMSKKAANAIKKAGSKTKARKGSGDKAITNEHYYTRKYVLKDMFERIVPLDFDEFVSEWWERGGVYHITTKAENGKLQAYIEKKLNQGGNYDPLEWEENYSSCKIVLIDDL